MPLRKLMVLEKVCDGGAEAGIDDLLSEM